MMRERFHIPRADDGSEHTYLCGNSLGLQPADAAAAVEEVLTSWAGKAVDGHFRGPHAWLTYHERLAADMAAIAGARAAEVTVMNGLTLDLHLLMISFYRPTPTRFRILMEAKAFPSDRYAVVSQLRLHGIDPAAGLVEIAPRPGETVVRTADIEELLRREGSSIALVLLAGVNYYTGQAFRMDRITAAARAAGCMTGYDLAHAAGNIPLHLHDWDVDFAAWCSYKYLNGGPGAPAAVFVHERHARAAELPRLAGWWGHDRATRFLMGPDFQPAEGAEGWQVSNQPVLSMAPLRASLEIFREAGMDRLRARSLELTGLLEDLLRRRAGPDCEIITPADSAERGCQLSLRFRRDGRRVFETLMKEGVVCDWREPEVIRLAPVPLYNTPADVERCVGVIAGARTPAHT
jgi:kynureninase